MKQMAERERQDFEAYVKAWRERLEEQEGARQIRPQHLRDVAHICARRLVQHFGASKVHLFGSLLEEGLVQDRSDIDLAVEGLEGELYFEALREVWALLPAGVDLDLVVLERAWPGLAERVRREGVLLDDAA